MLQRKCLVCALGTALAFWCVFCLVGCKEAARDGEKIVERETTAALDKSRSELPKPETIKPLDDSERVARALSEQDDMSQRIEDKMTKCAAGSMKGVVTKATKAALDTASKESKKPGATVQSIANAAEAAALQKAYDEQITIPQELFGCAIEEPIGRVILACGTNGAGCYEQNYMRSE